MLARVRFALMLHGLVSVLWTCGRYEMIDNMWLHVHVQTWKYIPSNCDIHCVYCLRVIMFGKVQTYVKVVTVVFHHMHKLHSLCLSRCK